MGWLAYQPQGLLGPLVRNEAEEGRLLKLHSKPLPERAVEHRVGGCVREVSEDDGVLVRQRVGLAGVEQPAASGQSDDQYCRARSYHPSKASGFRGGSRLDLYCRRKRPARIGITLQALQIRPNI